MSRWDWYQATLSESCRDAVIGELLARYDLSEVRPGRPKNGYESGADIARGDEVVAKVWWGGNPGLHVIGTGEQAPSVADAIRAVERQHRVTRCDACLDWVETGLFDRMSAGLIAYAEGRGVKINQQGDWVRGESRTLYLGSRSSPVQLVLYEKGYESGGDPAWVRLEARIRPAKDAKSRVASWEPHDCWRASRWVVQALEAIGFEKLQPYSIGTVRKPTDEERARAVLLSQYGAIIQRWAEDVGTYEALGAVLRETLEA